MNRDHVNELLNDIAEELNIPDSIFEQAVNSYSALGEYINNHSEYRVDVFPQGSIRLGTIIKPIGENDDYDVDLVCLLKDPFTDPKDLKNYVGDILKKSDRYSKMLEEEGRRCWTLKYADDAHFHMDVLPSQKDKSVVDNSISITDKKDGVYSFKSSNPKDYAHWFETAVRREFNYKEFKIEPIKKKKTGTLQKTIQLLKRHRDILYTNIPEKDQEYKPISIIITTIAAKLYTGKESLLEMMEKFANSWETCFRKDAFGDLILPNPVDLNENFSDKWIETPAKKDAFISWVERLQDDLEGKHYLGDTDVVSEAAHLKEMFGTSIVESMYSRRTNKLNSAYVSKANNTVGITGAKTPIPVKKHTFFGND